MTSLERIHILCCCKIMTNHKANEWYTCGLWVKTGVSFIVNTLSWVIRELEKKWDNKYERSHKNKNVRILKEIRTVKGQI